MTSVIVLTLIVMVLGCIILVSIAALTGREIEISQAKIVFPQKKIIELADDSSDN